MFAFPQVTSGKSPLLGFYDICRWRGSASRRPVLCVEGFLRSGAAGPHLPFVKAELKVYPHRKESVSQDGRGAGQSQAERPYICLVVWSGLTVGCVGRVGVSAVILKGFLCGWVHVGTTLYSEFVLLVMWEPQDCSAD